MKKTTITKVMNVENILPNPHNFFISDNSDVKSMTESILDSGIRVPPIVKLSKDDPDNGIVISGHLRLLGAKAAGLTEILVEIQEFADEDEELDALIDANFFRPIKPSELAMALHLKKELWAKPKGARSDLQNIPVLERIPTRERLAKMYRISPTYVDNYERILIEKPELFKRINSGAISVNGAIQLLNTIDQEQLKDLNETELMLKVIEFVEPEFKGQVESNKISLDEAFKQAVRLLSKKNKPQPKKETEATNVLLAEEETNTAVLMDVEESSGLATSSLTTKDESNTPALMDEAAAESSETLTTGEKSDSENDSMITLIHTVESVEEAKVEGEVEIIEKNESEISIEFNKLLESVNGQILSDIISNYVDDENAMREFLNKILSDEIKEQVLTTYSKVVE